MKHVSSKTGKIGDCDAKEPANCPFFDAEDPNGGHYENEAEMEAYVAAVNERKGISKVSSLESDYSSYLSPQQREFLEKEKGNNSVDSVLQKNLERLKGFEGYEQSGGYEMDEAYYKKMSTTLRGSQPWLRSVEHRIANPLPSAESILEEQIKASEEYLAETQDPRDYADGFQDPLAGYDIEEIERHKALIKGLPEKLSKTPEQAFSEVHEAFKDWRSQDETEDLMREELTNAHLYPELYSEVNREALKAFGKIESLENKWPEKNIDYSFYVESATAAEMFEHTPLEANAGYRIGPDGKAYVDSVFEGTVEIETKTDHKGYLTLSIGKGLPRELSVKTFIEGPAFEIAFGEDGGLTEADKARVIAPYALRLLKRYERKMASRAMTEMLESVRSDAKKHYDSMLSDFSEDYSKKSEKELMRNKELTEHATEAFARDFAEAKEKGHVAAFNMYAQKVFNQRKDFYDKAVVRWRNRNGFFRRAFPSAEDPRPTYESYNSFDSKNFKKELGTMKREAAIETEGKFLEAIGEDSFSSYYRKHYKTFAKKNPLALETSEKLNLANILTQNYLKGETGVIPENRWNYLVFKDRD